MVVLKKINASTLMETLVATVLIVVVFMMASLILNNTFSSYIKNNKHGLKNHIYELEYLYVSDKISLPYNSEYKDWSISIFEVIESSDIIISAIQNETKKELKQIIHAY